MRTSRGPLKGVANHYRAAKTTVVVLSCIPCNQAYYKERLAILKICLASLRCQDIADIMVIDNGSLPEVVEYLRSSLQEGIIHYLILSERNLGIAGALNIGLSAAPGEVIAFTNDDILFHPDWLEAHLRVLSIFPEAGLVSGQLIPGPDRQGAAIEALADEKTIVKPFNIPDSWIDRFAHSVGFTLQGWLAHPWVSTNRHTYRITRKGTSAYAGKTGYAHVFRKELLALVDCFPFPTGLCAGDSLDRRLAHAIGALGKVWLVTDGLYTEHLGNHLDKRTVEAVIRAGVGDALPKELL